MVASLAPLPGSLLESVPPERGVAQNLAGALGLLTAALIAASGRVPWTRVRVAAAVFMLEALAALAIGAASLSLPLVAGTPGAGREAARWCAAAAVLLSLPAVAMPFATGSSRPARAALMTAALLLALSIAAPDWLAARPAPLEAGALAAAAIVYTLILRGLRGVLHARPAAVVVAAGACATATTVLCLIVARPG